MKIALFQVREFRNLRLGGKPGTCWGSVRETSGTEGPKLDEDVHKILGGPKWDELKQSFKTNDPLVLRFCKIYPALNYGLKLCT